MASNLAVMASTLVVMASNRVAMASTLVAMAFPLELIPVWSNLLSKQKQLLVRSGLKKGWSLTTSKTSQG